jgi:hypothetical protein
MAEKIKATGIDVTDLSCSNPRFFPEEILGLAKLSVSLGVHIFIAFTLQISHIRMTVRTHLLP